MMLEWDQPPPRCPRCGMTMSGAVIWGGSGDVWCSSALRPENSHYRDFAWSNMRRAPVGIALQSTAHPVAPWWKRLWFWLRYRGLLPDALETAEVDLSPREHRGLMPRVLDREKP